MIHLFQQREKCIGCNACVEAAPYRWRMSKKDGRCTLIGATHKKGFYHVRVSDDEREDNLRAAANCPVKIIRIEEI
jgi:ferredoxin